MTACVSLFRGINVGGHQKIKMSELKDLHESLGLRDVSTYVQSGNVVFTTDEPDLAQLPQQIERGFEQRFGIHAEAIVRTSTELREIMEKNPFQNQQAKEPKWVVVMFLAARPEKTAWEALANSYAGHEEFSLIGKEMYLYYPNGIGRSKLSGAFIERKLKMAGTARNWNTVTQILEMMRR